MSSLNLHLRDMRQLFSSQSKSEPAISVRRNCILVNFETLRGIVLVDRCEAIRGGAWKIVLRDLAFFSRFMFGPGMYLDGTLRAYFHIRWWWTSCWLRLENL